MRGVAGRSFEAACTERMVERGEELQAASRGLPWDNLSPGKLRRSGGIAEKFAVNLLGCDDFAVGYPIRQFIHQHPKEEECQKSQI